MKMEAEKDNWLKLEDLQSLKLAGLNSNKKKVELGDILSSSGKPAAQGRAYMMMNKLCWGEKRLSWNYSLLTSLMETLYL